MSSRENINSVELPLHGSAQLRDVAEKIVRGGRINQSEATILWHEAPLSLMGMLALDIKRRKSGDAVFYNRNFHIEPTNICLFRCKFCSYRREADSPEAWQMTLEDVEEMAHRFSGKGVTEVHIVGGVHPDHDLEYYAEMIRRVKSILPHAAIKAFTAIELDYMIQKAGLSTEEGLSKLIEAGMQAIPGGGAEIFDPELRARICPEKGDAESWLSLHRSAHQLGLTTNATILYGHVENLAHRLDHLERLRSLQDETGGFSAFIPLKFRSEGNSLSGAGETSISEDLRMLALSRIYLDNFPHIKAYWPMYGKTTTQLALAFGADDIDGTIDDSTRIYSMAGAEDVHPSMSVADIERLVTSAGLRPVERDTFYNPVEK